MEHPSLRYSLVRNRIGAFIYYFRTDLHQSQHDPAAVVEYRRRDNIGPGLLTLHPSGFAHGPHLKEFALAEAINKGERRYTDAVAVMIDTCFPIALAPLPRAYQCADGSACINHAELVCKARGSELPLEFLNDPLMYLGGLFGSSIRNGGVGYCCLAGWGMVESIESGKLQSPFLHFASASTSRCAMPPTTISSVRLRRRWWQNRRRVEPMVACDVVSACTRTASYLNSTGPFSLPAPY